MSTVWFWQSLEHLELSVAEKRAVVSELAPVYGVSLACELLGLSRSSFYYQVDEPDDSDCKDAIQEIAGQWPRYGYRRFLDEVYMRKRIHSALGYLTPVEFESQWLARKAGPTELA